ncbi:MAG TPA: propionyl-CoA synthetase, partial [Deltaproteobacteria bacterium]|nr:propionyl-CoA synthetase [Deltaproteobacteria bacterium]
MSYFEIFRKSLEQPELFWREQAEQIKWYEFPETILSQDEHGFYRWFTGGKLNTSYLALDVQIEEGRGAQPALIYDSPATNSQR